MSRIGKLPIEIPKGVVVSLTDTTLSISGPKGALTRSLMNEIALVISDNRISFSLKVNDLKSRAAWGLTRTLVDNMVIGVTKGFEKALEINGVGYRAEAKGGVLNLALGYSHPIAFPLPEGITVDVDKMTKLLVKGIDKEVVGAIAAKIRSFRPPEPYKGKGIKYATETILRKAGKTGKK